MMQKVLDIRDRLAIVMAHPDDEVLWASSVLRDAEKIVLVYGELPGNPVLTEGRRAAMADFPLPTLDWLELTESGVFDSASWPEVRETEYGLFPHPALKVLDCFDADLYRALFDRIRDLLRPRLVGMRHVIAHGPWGEYGHEDHVQVFRVVASLAEELGFQLWVPAYVAPKSEALMRRNLRFFGRPTAPLPTDRVLAEELSAIYKRTNTWTWFDSYAWPRTEQFLPWVAGGAAPGDDAEAGDVQRIVFPPVPGENRPRIVRFLRRVVRKTLNLTNGRRTG